MRHYHSQMPEIAVAGHICLDILPAFPGDARIIPGKLLALEPAVFSTGGAVSNTGLALQRLGFGPRLLGKVGDDRIGRTILDILGEYGEGLAAGMIVASGEHSSYTIVVSPPGQDRCFWHYEGTNASFGEADIPEEALGGLRLFHLGYPTLMSGLYRNGGEGLERLLRRVKSRGITVSLDLAEPDPASEAARQDWREIFARVLPHVDIFLPSLEELLFLLRREIFYRMREKYGDNLLPHADGELLADLSGELLEMGVAIAGLKLGDKGIYLRTAEKRERFVRMGGAAPAGLENWLGRELLAPCFQVKVQGATGAGDCTIAGFLGSLLEGLSPEAALLHAVAVGACNVEQPDAVSGIPAWGAVERRLEAGAGWMQLPTLGTLTGWNYRESDRLYHSGRDMKRTHQEGEEPII